MFFLERWKTYPTRADCAWNWWRQKEDRWPKQVWEHTCILECSGIHDPLYTISHNPVSLNVGPVLLDNYQKNWSLLRSKETLVSELVGETVFAYWSISINEEIGDTIPICQLLIIDSANSIATSNRCFPYFKTGTTHNSVQAIDSSGPKRTWYMFMCVGPNGLLWHVTQPSFASSSYYSEY